MLSGVSLLTVSNVNNPVGLVCLLYVMWSAHFFVTHIQTEKISSWNGPTVHVCCFMLARASTKTFVSRVRKTAKKFFVSRKNSLAGSLISWGITVLQRNVPEAVDSHSVTHTHTKHSVMGLKIHDHAHKSPSLDRYTDPLSICIKAFLYLWVWILWPS